MSCASSFDGHYKVVKLSYEKYDALIEAYESSLAASSVQVRLFSIKPSPVKKPKKSKKLNGIGFGGTPVSNTGLNSQTNNIDTKRGYEVGVDWLTIVCYHDPSSEFGYDPSVAIDIVEGNLGEKIEFVNGRPDFDGKKYASSSQASLHGTRAMSNPPGEDESERGEIRFKIPGKALSVASPSDIRDMCQILSAFFEVRCTRFDVAIDDYNKLLDLDEIYEVQQNGDFAHVQKFGYHESGERGKLHRGRTLTFGSRQSNAFVRIYDKAVESKGDIDAIRYEVEFSDDKANALFHEWIEFPLHNEQIAAKHIAGAALGAVRFCDRTTDERNLDRLDDLPWYKRICDSVASGFRVRLRKKERYLDRAVGWVEKAVMPTLAMIRKYMDADDLFLQWIFDSTTEKMGELSSIKLEMIKIQQQQDKEQQIDSHIRKYNNTYRPNPTKVNDDLVAARKAKTDLNNRVARDKYMSEIREIKQRVAKSFFERSS